MNEVDLGPTALSILLALSVASVVGAAAVFRRFTDRKALKEVANRIVAHLLECVLFQDDPRLVFRAQGDLIRENLCLLRLIVLPCLLLLAPFWILFAEMDANFARAPLVLEKPAVLTLSGTGAGARLTAPSCIQVETPGVRDVFANQVSWRIRPVSAGFGQVRIVSAGRVETANIRAGKGLLARMVNPFEKPRIRIQYPPATVVQLHWFTWYALAVFVTALIVWMPYA